MRMKTSTASLVISILSVCSKVTRSFQTPRIRDSQLTLKKFHLKTLNSAPNGLGNGDSSSSETIEILSLRTENSADENRFLGFSEVETTSEPQYDWKEFRPEGRGILRKLRWLITGASPYARESETEMQQNLVSLARMLLLLREYETRFGMPDFGGPEIQRRVLSDITMDLYNSGTPTWVLETVMIRVAEGLTGKEGVRVMLLPNRAFIMYPPETNANATAFTDMFYIVPGFNIARLGEIEQAAVRLASFASNTKSVERLGADSFRMPSKDQLVSIEEQQEAKFKMDTSQTKEELAEEILDLASNTYGLFFFLNNPKFQLAVENIPDDATFWEVQDSTRELFSRLAANEASQSLKTIYKEEKQIYSSKQVAFFRIISAAGASSMWFGGSIYDMIVAGLLAVSVAKIGTSKALAFEERILTEVVASFFVGLVAGVLAIQFPQKFCFGSIAIAAMLDIMQGFKVVYAVIEVMSRNIVSGTSRLLEGILFTGLLSYTLKFGLSTAFRLSFGVEPPMPLDVKNFLVSTNGISQWIYPFLLPFTAMGWSGLFRPSVADLPLMAMHGILAFGLTMVGAPLFLAAMCVTLSAGIISRFTGREALGNTLAGLYALVPGAFMVRALLNPNMSVFLENVLVSATTIGLGGWTGTILCSPTIIGKTSGFMGFGKDKQERKRKQKQAMIYF